MNSRNMLALVAFYILAAISPAASGGPANLDESLVKNFAKINDYLEKKVESDNLEANMAKAEKWMKDKFKLSKLFDSSLTRALQIFNSLPKAIENATNCEFNLSSRRLLEKCDAGLADKAHVNSPDYSVKRIDRIIESVAYKSVRLCMLTPDMIQRRPAMKFAFKQLAYDHINKVLFDRVYTLNLESNMRAVEDFLGGSKKDGSWAPALKQLLSLKLISTEESCSEFGTEIVKKNDLATKGEMHTSTVGFMRRITKIVYHYSVEHARVCDPIHQRNCLALLNQLDVQTYRRVLALASAYYLPPLLPYDLVAEVDSKQVGEDFTIQSIADLDETRRISGFVKPDSEKLLRYLETVMKQDPRLRFLEKVFDEKLGKRVIREDKILEIYNEHIYEPCEKLNSIMRSDVEVFDYFNWLVTSFSSDSSDNRPLNFRLLHAAVHLCRDMLDKSRHISGLLFQIGIAS